MYRVIIADDENVIRNGIVQLVDWKALDCGIVCECSNGSEVLYYLEDHPADIVISDIKMPGMDGISLVQELQQKYPKIKVVMLTVYNKFDFAQKALRYGASDYIVKNEFITELPKTIVRLTKIIEKQKSNEGQVEQNQELVQREIKNMTRYLLESLALSKAFPMENDIEKFGLDQKKYCVCSCEITYYEKQQDNPDKVRTIENFLNITINQYEHYIVNVNKKNMAIILCCDKTKDFTVKDAAIMISGVLRIVEEFMHFQIKFGISQVIDDIRLLHVAYGQSVEALFRIANSGNEVLIYTDDGEQNNRQIPVDRYSDKIIERLFSKQFEQAMSVLDEMKHTIVESKLSLTTVKINVINMCSALFRKIEEYYLWEDAQKTETELYNDINESTTIYTMFSLCRQLLQTLQDIINENKMDKHYIVSAINEYIQENYTKNITLQDISEKIHVSPSYISRIYKKKTDMTVTNSINRLRVEKSKSLLRDTTYKIYEIAELIGIEDPGYFTNMFTKYTGCSPSQYRGNHNTENKKTE
jgi:two-component system response regulator YesN